MLALRKVERVVDGLSLDEIEAPGSPPPGYAKIKVNKAGICGTDLAIFNWAPFLRHMKVPIVLGHEISGIVDAVGEGVTRVKVGDFVSVESHIPCGRCYNCLRGFTHVCENTRYPGSTSMADSPRIRICQSKFSGSLTVAFRLTLPPCLSRSALRSTPQWTVPALPA